MRDLLTNPMWTADDLGKGIPETLHACSVCLPTTQSIIDYEEGRSCVVDRMEAGYPRFFIHPTVKELFAKSKSELCSKGEDLVLFPSIESAQRAAKFLEEKVGEIPKIEEYFSLYALIIAEENIRYGYDYWRYTGEVVSSRQAENFLANKAVDKNTFLTNSLMIRSQLAGYYKAEAGDLFLYQSGMSAWYAAHRCIIEKAKGKKTLQLEFPYVDLFSIQRHFGNGFDFESNTSGAFLASILESIRSSEYVAVYVEVPSNPLLKVLDIPAVAEACRDSGTFFIIDDTIASVLNVDLTDYADVVITSLSKWASGCSDVMAGLATVNPKSPRYEELKEWFAVDCPEATGGWLFAEDSAVLANNLKGFEARMQKVNKNGALLAQYCLEQPEVQQVYYPVLSGTSTLVSNSREQYEKVLRTKNNQIGAVVPGASGLFSLIFKKPEEAQIFYDALEVSKGPSLGTEFSLACLYTLLAHYHEREFSESCGIDAYLVRLSIGIEEKDELLARFDRAFAAIR